MERHTHDVSEITRPISSGFNPAKLIGLLAVIGLVWAMMKHRARSGFGPMSGGGGGGGRWGGRREAIAAFHRQLHEGDAESPVADEGSATA